MPSQKIRCGVLAIKELKVKGKRQTHKQLIITYWANKADMMLAKALKYKLIVKLDIHKNINAYIKVWHLYIHSEISFNPITCTPQRES